MHGQQNIKTCTVLLPPGVNPVAVNKYIIPNFIVKYDVLITLTFKSLAVSLLTNSFKI